MEQHLPAIFLGLILAAIAIHAAARWHLKTKAKAKTVSALAKTAEAALDEADKLVAADTAAIEDLVRARDANLERIAVSRKRLAGLGTTAPGG